MSAMKKEKKSEAAEKKIRVTTLVSALAIFMAVLILVIFTVTYGTKTETAAKVAKVVPMPSAVIGWTNFVFLDDMQSNLASVQKFYQTNNFSKEGLRVDFSTEDGKKRLKIKEREILDKMVEDKIIMLLAKDQGVTVLEKEVDLAVTKKLDEFGTAVDVEKDLKNSYGWNLNDFKERVVLPLMYQQALAKKISEQDNSAAKAKAKIEAAQKKLENGMEFAEVVKSYSEGSSKEKAGELGWVNQKQVLPELQTALFEDTRLEKNEIFESQLGFHIIEVKDRKIEDKEQLLLLRQVFVKKKTFADWLEEQKKKISVFVPLKEYVWDNGSVNFSDQQMRQFETEQRSSLQGDASIMF